MDVLALLTEKADVENASWSFDCDGVVHGLSSRPRPKVFLRKNQPRNRWPFSAAHEFGHVMIPWHVENATCHVGRVGTRKYEVQANEFASRVLVPQRYLESLVGQAREPDEWLELLDRCEISAHASILALRRILPAGFLYVIEQANTPDVVVESVGTNLYAPNLITSHENLVRGSEHHGYSEFRGRDVRWYRYTKDENPVSPHDGRAAKSILEGVLERLGRSLSDGRDRKTSLAASIGGKLRNRGNLDAAQMYGIVVYHLSSDPEWADFLRDSEFRDYLGKRMHEMNRQQ
nr:ImmA/IrrE family metallo-endopeptidase [Actinomycetospora sp. NBRC 106378]